MQRKCDLDQGGLGRCAGCRLRRNIVFKPMSTGRIGTTCALLYSSEKDQWRSELREIRR